MKKISTNSSVKGSILDHQFRIKKHFGQNFLKDQNVLSQIVEKSIIDKDVDVIEVGPGLGSLTEFLLEKANRVLAYEIDRDLIPILKRNFKNENNLILINKDILKVDIDKEINEILGENSQVIVVSNLPYYITTPILMKFLETSYRVKKMVFMVQLEVANRITSKPNTKDYNALSIAIQYRADAQILLKVPRTAFIPEPNVDSAVVEVKIKDQLPNPAKNETFFFQFVHQCFSQRRKTLVNNIHHHYPDLSKEQLESILKEEGINPQIRSEAISVNDFVRLSDILYTQIH